MSECHKDLEHASIDVHTGVHHLRSRRLHRFMPEFVRQKFRADVHRSCPSLESLDLTAGLCGQSSPRLPNRLALRPARLEESPQSMTLSHRCLLDRQAVAMYVLFGEKFPRRVKVGGCFEGGLRNHGAPGFQDPGTINGFAEVTHKDHAADSIAELSRHVSALATMFVCSQERGRGTCRRDDRSPPHG